VTRLASLALHQDGVAWTHCAASLDEHSCNVAKRNRENATYDVRTNREPHSERLHVRLTATEVEALDYLALRWDSNRSTVVRSLIVGATLSELDQLDAIDAAEPSFDATLVDLPSIDDALAGL
jgi:hypothetical protein